MIRSLLLHKQASHCVHLKLGHRFHALLKVCSGRDDIVPLIQKRGTWKMLILETKAKHNLTKEIFFFIINENLFNKLFMRSHDLYKIEYRKV